MTDIFRVKLNNEGRMVIPAVCRQKLGIAPGQEVLLRITDDGLELTTFDRAMAKFQAEVQSLVGPERSLTDEIIAESRAEAARE